MAEEIPDAISRGNAELPRENLVRAVMDGGVEFRDTGADTPDDGRLGTLTGNFAVFDTFTEINSAWEGNFLERIAPSAFKKTVRENLAGMRVLFQHGRDPMVGDKPLGPIESLSADAAYEVPLLDTSYNRDLLPGLKAGVYGASFRFQVMKEELKQDPGVSDANPKGLPERTITEARVMEFGPVTFPAYPGASAGVRSLTDEFMEKPRVQDPVGYPSSFTVTTSPNVTASASGATNLTITNLRSPLTSADAPQSLQPEPAVEATPAVLQDEEPEHSPEASRATPEPDKPEQTSEQKEQTMTEYRSVEELDARLAEIKSEQDEMSAEAGVRAFDTDTQGRWDELITERDELDRDKTNYLERQSYLAAQTEKPAAKEYGAGSAGAVANRNKAPENIFDLAEYHTRSTSNDHMGRLYEEGAKRAIEGFRYPNERANREDTSEIVDRLLASDGPNKEVAQRLLIHGSPTYRSAFWKQLARQPLSREEQAAMANGMELEARSVTTTTTGGVTVPVQIDPTILLTSTGAINPFRQVARIVQTTSHQWQGVTSTGITAAYAAEGAVMSDNSPTLVAPAITPERANAFVPFAWEAGQDWGSLETDMARLFADAKDIVEATKFASGAGSGSDEPQGVLVGAGTVVGSSATTTVGTVDIYALEAALPVRFQPNAVWLATPALFSRIRSQAALGSNSGGIWADSLQVGQPARLLGYPAYKASTVGTAGNAAVSVASTKWGILGDFSYYAIVDRIGFQVRYVENLFNGNTAGGIAYPNGMSGLVTYWRNSAGVLGSNAFRTGTVT